ncbi:Lead, cadmium, zinc and mercury transporting ATPase, Copper-translocating P-type ATPase [Streptococcus infantarius subsp. infantarius]|uniref:heavy metal translocating P-type ATPase n=2 Tax=Streptococcus infantarius TaxID=102684 RepID=UPI00208E0A56|nr:copper-translocating P-type ATPase [Streptococcus infantarius]MCO4480269.1 Lead, cadmium, zinc and mercury transporting ATPase, Copper-translocating P-type ATPase [Streptococcus infantarius subsp. infantarius]MCO4482148.1 Lead, cadmium, zinc and mercury transporting ATPase, Copper-translocating P-type ATPase [Streptococcus infantarius subsp. infantarius]MCO4486861.1 Lead, cadmium, zinc and mercury transporting ATPase, Copper-translocating P-type ATPase [Streptococcus infantarius subsp. infant
MRNNKKHSSHSHHNHGDMDHSKHDHNEIEHSQMDHSKMNHSAMDHSKMNHSAMDHSEMDHGAMGGHAHHHHGSFKEIFLKSLPLGIAILLITPLMDIQLPFQIIFPYADVVAAVLATILYIYGGKPFYMGAKDEFNSKAPGMMSLITLGITVSYAYSVYAVAARYVTGEHVMDFFFEFTTLILIMLLGHWIEMKALGEAGDAQKALAELVPKDAHVVLEDDSIETRPVSELQIGDVIRVQAGENVPADGIIIRGESRVNEALVTGESKPIEKKPGDEVIGGSTNGGGVLYVEIKQTGDKSFISQVQTLISQAQSQPSRAENVAHKVASWLFYIAVVVALIALVVWMIIADLPTAVIFTVTALVIACPHALGLAIPLVVSRSTSLGASRGLLVKNREALELTTKADVMVLDKTGTLTTGEFKVLDVTVLSDKYSEEEITGLLAGIEAGSSHPIAQSIVNHAEAKGIKSVSFDSIEIVSGAGIEGEANGHHYQLISQKAYGKALRMDIPKGATLSILVENNEAIGAVALGDELKETSRNLIEVLKKYGIEPLMATGDNEEAAQGVAEVLGIQYQANQSPEDKYKLVESMKNQNKTVIMVGDGVNDAPSLALADVGIAIGAGTQVALDSADIILTQSDPGDIESFIELANKTTRKMKQNLVWGAGYNFIAIPIAAGILAPIGITLSPAVGAVLMSLSTVIVAINAMTLKLEPK